MVSSDAIRALQVYFKPVPHVHYESINKTGSNFTAHERKREKKVVGIKLTLL